jgi:hypothetical protein
MESKKIKAPIELCARNMPRPMYPLMIQLCYFCQKNSSEKECLQNNNGQTYFMIKMCPKCMEYNKALQEAGKSVLQKQLEEREQMAMGKFFDRN